MTSSTLYAPSDFVELTEATVGNTVSTTKALLAPKELVAPGEAKVSVAALPAPSFIDPLFRASALVET